MPVLSREWKRFTEDCERKWCDQLSQSVSEGSANERKWKEPDLEIFVFVFL